ncbi:MAG: hypothetical protein K8S87_11795 [Planctomycetes bacterium]|nr:hypothetical protein [Planctomycetota bacterium]
MSGLFLIAVISIPFIAGFSGYLDLRKSISEFNATGVNKIRKSLLPEFGDIAMIIILSAFVIAYSSGTSG